MKILNKAREGLKNCYNVLVTMEELEQAFNIEVIEKSKKIKLDGFRPGKVPVDVIKKMYGDAIRYESKKSLIESSINDFFVKEKVNISFSYTTDIVKDDENGVEFTINFETIPSFKLKDLSNSVLTKYVSVISEEESLKILTLIQESVKNWIVVEDDVKVAEGHKIEINLEQLSNLKKCVANKIDNIEILVGDNRVVDDFWKNFIGMKNSETCEFNLVYPKNFADTVVAGKTIRYKGFLNKVLEEKSFEMNDEFAKKIGYDSFVLAKEWAVENTQKKYEKMSRELMRRELLEIMSDMYDFDVPENMLNVEIREVERHVKEEAEKMNKIFDQKMQDECLKIARQRVRLGFVVSEIAKVEKLSVSQNEIIAAIKNIASMYPGQEKEVFALYKNNDSISTIVGPILESKVIDKLLSTIKTKDVSCSVEKMIEMDEEKLNILIAADDISSVDEIPSVNEVIEEEKPAKKSVAEKKSPKKTEKSVKVTKSSDK